MATFTFEELVKNYTPLVVSVALKIVPRVDMVDDAKQEVFIRLFKKYSDGDFDPTDKFENNINSLSAIIKKTARGITLDYLRDLGRGDVCAQGYADVFDPRLALEAPSTDPDERTEQLDAMLKEYSDEVNQLMDLRRRGYQWSEIVKIVDMSVPQAKMLMSRTVAKLRETAQADQV